MLCSSKTNSSYTTHINTNNITNNSNNKNIMTMIDMNVVENDTKRCFSHVIQKKLQQEGKNNDDTSTTANSTLGSTTLSSAGEKIMVISSELQIINDDVDDDDDDCVDINPFSSSDEDDDHDDHDHDATTSEMKRCSLTEENSSELFEEEHEPEQDGPTPILKTSATKKLLTTTTTTRSVSDSHLLDKSSLSETTTSIQQQNEKRRRCRFTTLTVREYPRILGDNVTVMGPPISLSWEYDDESVYDLEEYLIAVQDSRRTQAELKMPSKHRDTMLRDYGYTRKEIQSACKKSTIARNQRKRTIETFKLQPIEEFFEKVKKNGKKNPISALRKIRRESSVLSMMKRKTI